MPRRARLTRGQQRRSFDQILNSNRNILRQLRDNDYRGVLASSNPRIARLANAERSKSFNDIDNQAYRLINRAEEQYNFDRIDRIQNIRQRYRDNISNTLGGADLTPIGDPVAAQTPVDRATYMGLAGARENRSIQYNQRGSGGGGGTALGGVG